MKRGHCYNGGAMNFKVRRRMYTIEHYNTNMYEYCTTYVQYMYANVKKLFTDFYTHLLRLNKFLNLPYLLTQ